MAAAVSGAAHVHTSRSPGLAAPQPGWALQYTTDLQPAGARTSEPKTLATHTTAANIELLLRFHRLTGDARFLARGGAWTGAEVR